MANVGVTFDFAAESAKLRTEIDKVRKELSTINATTKGIKDGFKLVGGAIAGAFSISAITGFLSRVNDVADNLNDLAGRLGASASGLQSLQIAASLAGGSAESVNTAIAKMNVTLGDAVNGNKQAAAAFQKLGLSAQDLAQLKPDEAFRRIADAASQIPNTFQRASIAQDIFGKGAAEIAGLLAEGGAAIDAVNQKLDEQGARLTDLDVAKIGMMNDELQFQQTVVNNLGIKFLSGFSPAIGVATSALGEMLGTLGGATDAGEKFGVITTAAIKLIQAGAYLLVAAFENARANIALILNVVFSGIEKVTGGLAFLADAAGLDGIAESLRNGRDAVSGIAESMRDISASARANAVEAVGYAKTAAMEFLNAEEIFAQAKAKADASAAETAARNAAASGVATTLPGGKAGYDPNAARMSGDTGFGTDRKTFDLAAIETDPKLLYQQQLNAELERLASEQAASELNIAQVRDASLLDQLFLRNDLMVAAEEAKNATLGDLMGQLVQMGIQQGGALGKFAKAYAIAQTVWSTSQAIMRTMASVPYPANLAAAAMVAARGAMQLANIKKTNVGGNGTIAGAGGGGAPSIAESVPTGTQRSTESDQKSATQIIVNGNLFAAQETVDWLVEKIGEAVNGRDLVFINSNSRQAMELVGA